MFEAILMNLIFLSAVYAFLPFLFIILVLTQIGRIRGARLLAKAKSRPAPVIE